MSSSTRGAEGKVFPLIAVFGRQELGTGLGLPEVGNSCRGRAGAAPEQKLTLEPGMEGQRVCGQEVGREGRVSLAEGTV